MATQKATAFDPAAFLAAAKALAERPLTPVTMPGLPPCFKRTLTAGDVIDASGARERLQTAGLEPGRKVDIAIGLAQSLCGPGGEPIFDAGNREHIELLMSIPWYSIGSVAAGDAGPNA